MDQDFWAPYDIIFAQNKFHFLHKDSVYDSTYGAMKSFVFHELVNLYMKQDNISGMKDHFKRIYFDEGKSMGFYSFIHLYLEGKKNNSKRRIFLEYFKAPYHIINYTKYGLPQDKIDKLHSIQVRRIEKYYDGSTIMELNNQIVGRILFRENEVLLKVTGDF